MLFRSGRCLIMNAETGEKLSQTDTINSGAFNTLDLTQQFTLDQTGGNYQYSPFYYCNANAGGGLWAQYGFSDIDIASRWYSIGATLDPAVYYKQLSGTGVSPTVGGITAWDWQTFDSNSGNTSTGFVQTLAAGSRLPSDATVIAGTGSGSNVVQLTQAV